jgi:hypothetical protein
MSRPIRPGLNFDISCKLWIEVPLLMWILRMLLLLAAVLSLFAQTPAVASPVAQETARPAATQSVAAAQPPTQSPEEQSPGASAPAGSAVGGPAVAAPSAGVPSVGAPAVVAPGVESLAAPAPPSSSTPSSSTSSSSSAASPNPAPSHLASTTYLLDTGTHVPLSLINSVSTKNALPGDRVYLETVFPILTGGRIVIPPGSYVMGTITAIKRPGKVKGRGEFHLRFDSLTLPNGTTRDFRAHVTGLDGRASEELDHKEGTIRSEGNKAGDVRTIGESTAAGASIGALAGSISGATGMGAAIGAGAGAAAALAGIMLTRGPDAVLAKGTTIEMILDRQVQFEAAELDFSNSFPRRSSASDSGGPLPSKRRQPAPYPGRIPN